MFVGHGLVAFAVVSVVATRIGYSIRKSLLLGIIGFCFGISPDIDVLLATDAVLETLAGPVGGGSDAFADTVHRTITHSVIMGAISALLVYFVQVLLRTKSSGTRVLFATLSGVTSPTVKTVWASMDSHRLPLVPHGLKWEFQVTLASLTRYHG